FVGGSGSVTVTVMLPVATRRPSDLAVLVTVVVLTAKLLPLAGTLAMFVTAQLSVAVTTNVTLLEHVPANTFTTRLVEQVITGDCVPMTVTVNFRLALFPLASFAVLITFVVPTLKQVPTAGTLAMFV